MVKKIVAVVTLVALMIVIVGCSAHIHKVGNGAQNGAVLQERQWYVLWGLVPINSVDTNAMASGAEDYTIKTESSAVDIIINIFTGYVSVVSRTVTVTK